MADGLDDADADPRSLRDFRQILLWPLRLMPLPEGETAAHHGERLGPPWHEVHDEISCDPAQFLERHYSEFITFLPHVQRLLYGMGRSRGGASPIRVFRRGDVRAVRVLHVDGELQTVEVVHADLYFFHDLEVFILALELHAERIALDRAQALLFRFGRAYPTYWNADGSGGHCLRKVEWLDAEGRVLAASDYEQRERFLGYVTRHRTPCIAAHWAFLLSPLVPGEEQDGGPLRFGQLEFHRMPLAAYLATEGRAALTRADYARLAFVTEPGPADVLPLPARELEGFERIHCYDRYLREDGSGTRYIATGDAFFMVGSVREPFFVDPRIGLAEQFRHQYLLLFLLPHVQKAALLMFSDRLGEALVKLDVADPDSVRRFKRDIRRVKEVFLRFSHRYWFHDVSDQWQAKALYRMARDFLGAETLYAEVREEIADMSDYLDSDSLRRQANTVVRLTVVTTFGLIGTVVTGFLGMNLFALAEEPLPVKLAYFSVTTVATIWLTMYTIARSKRLSDFLEVLTEERVPGRVKLATFIEVWRRRRRID